MKVEHPRIVIELEGEEERRLLLEGEEKRRLLKAALYAACELGQDAVRKERVPDILVRAGIDPVQPRDAGAMRDLAARLHEWL